MPPGNPPVKRIAFHFLTFSQFFARRKSVYLSTTGTSFTNSNFPSAILISAFVCNLILTSVTAGTYFNLGFAGQPIAHTDGLWNFLGMFLAGFGCVLLGGCPLRQLVLSGEGNTDSAITVIGLIIGAAFAHNFGLASSGEGPTLNGKIAVIIGIIVITVIAFVNTMQAKKQ